MCHVYAAPPNYSYVSLFFCCCLQERLKYYHSTRVAKSSESKETKRDNKRDDASPKRNVVI